MLTIVVARPLGGFAGSFEIEIETALKRGSRTEWRSREGEKLDATWTGRGMGGQPASASMVPAIISLNINFVRPSCA
ncbi:uncharacterized protein MYCGRDRAFT_104609 [Zymoseptoria tritici IPO323]|uniref:Uncharacterized protein n=1 Tax=Zymoseptoria tritici (strain CBS 115943 / IPO323) TaxID=336722 RepID=F9XBH2_ZYMTI|nr:uncharacterized protein MYCGRDRAFT_104609 [Zymoseptoria tritici IPO323]EGP87504.1 hypothetical protein MYCGRDRAFT_104609 [Zymoseptoria tritici IPO323]